MKRVSFFRIATLLVVFLCCALARESGWFVRLDNGIAEQRMAMQTRQASGRIVLLEIDNKSLTSIGVWPWNRSIYADIIRKSFNAGAEELAFDIDFSSKSITEEDQAFAEALDSAAGPVTLAVFQQFATARMEADALRFNRPVEALSNSAWLATVNVIADPDGFVRSFPLAQSIDGELFPSLTSTLGGLQQIEATSQLVNFNIDPASIPTYSVIDLLDGTLAPDALKGRKVLVGAGAAELRDTMAVPVFGVMSGPKLQILAAENLIQGTNLQRAPHSWVYVIGTLAMLPTLFLLLFGPFNTYSRIAGLLLLATGIEFLGYRLYADEHILLDTGILLATLLATGVIVTLTDVSIKSILLNLSHRHGKSISDLLDTIVKDSLTGIVIVGADGRIISISQQAGAMLARFGYEAKKGDLFASALPWEFGRRIADGLKGSTATKPSANYQTLSIMRNEGTRYFEYSITPSLIAPDGKEQKEEDKVITLLFQDITDAYLEQIRLAYAADHDPLTELFNLNGFCNQIDGMVTYTTEGSGRKGLVFACQARRLEKISQMLGPDYCDILLQQIGLALTDCARFDAVGCTDHKRFLLFKLHAGEEDIAGLTATIHQCLDRPYDVRGHSIIVGGQVGVARFDPDTMQTAADLAEAASIALDRSLETGERTLFYSPALAADVHLQRLLEQEIVSAFEHSEFELHYQPQVDLKSRKIIGCEALARWNHPERGLIRPDHFIPILEETGKIVDLGRWIMQTACREAMSWPEPVTVAVNVSAVQFQRSDILQDIEQALQSSGLPRHRLHIEITESLFIAETAAIIEQLNAIRSHGIKIALDDFGTGYSSLSYIHQFPLDKIKIDRAFVKDLPYSTDSLAVINAVTALARGFDMQIIAEGMETEEQAEILRLAGCHIGQGYYFGRPVTCGEFASALKKLSMDVDETTELRQAI
nr:EAL domain-containing protein [uncultured Cohaesibacter sp.]